MGTLITQDERISAYPCSNILLEVERGKRTTLKKAAVKICVEEYHCSSELLVAVNNSCYSEEWHKTEYLICFSQSCLR